MEKSIEDIWKEGFLKSDALVAPQINNLYNQKSMHIIDKFRRMFRINLIAIVAFSLVFLIVTYFLGIFVMGIIFFVALMAVAVVNKSLLNSLEEIDKGENSYQYLKAFNQWIGKQISINQRMSSFLYPVFFLAIVLGLWYKDVQGMLLGERFLHKFLIHFPDTHLFLGVPLIGIVIVILILGLLAYFGGRIYLWDVNVIYGRLFKKLEELMADIESLNS